MMTFDTAPASMASPPFMRAGVRAANGKDHLFTFRFLGFVFYSDWFHFLFMLLLDVHEGTSLDEGLRTSLYVSTSLTHSIIF